MMKKKLLYYGIPVAALGIAATVWAILVFAGVETGARKPLQVPHLPDPTPAKKQVKWIPVESEVDSHWTSTLWQRDDRKWVFTRQGISDQVLSNNPGNPDLPGTASDPTITAKVDSTNPIYQPTAGYQPSDRSKKYPNNQVSGAEMVWAQFKPAEAGYAEGVSLTIKNQIYLYGTIEIYGKATNDYGTENGKGKATYKNDVLIVWQGNVIESKEIDLASDDKIKVGGTKQLKATVKTQPYKNAAWTAPFDVTTTTTNVRYESSDPSVATVSPTGLVTGLKKGSATITVHFEKDGYHLIDKVNIGVDTDVKPDPGGHGRIIFTPDNSDSMEPPIVRGWARRDFQVTASVVDYEPVDYSTTVSGTQEYDSICYGTDSKGKSYSYSCTKTRSVTVPYSWHQEADIGNIKITGDATGANQVMITKEADNQKLHGEVQWLPGVETWSLPPRTTASKPSPPATPSPITGDSGIYRLDKTKPTQSVVPESHGWTNQPIIIQITDKDNLSGFYGTKYDLTNISYYANGNMQADATERGLSWNPKLTIAQQGVYVLKTKLGDYAGWPEVPPDGPQNYTFTDYRYDAIPPYPAEFITGTGGIVKNGGFDYIADQNNTVRFRVGDELSGVVRTEFSWSKSPDMSRPSVNNWNGGWNDVPVTTPDYASGPNQMSAWVDVSLDSKTYYSSYQANNYDDMKEGTWYLHIRQTDRAGNVTHTVSPPIFINKVKNLRVFNVSDFAWKSTFVSPVGADTGNKVNGIGTEDMPLYWNKQHRNISLGYGVDYKFDSVGFDESNDRILLKMDYHAIDENGNFYSYDDVYVETKKGDFVKLENSEYAGEADLVQFVKNGNDKWIAYESTIKKNQRILPMYQEDTAKQKYSTIKYRTFLPPTTKFVTKGEKLDLIKKTNMHKYRELVTFTIEAYRQGHAQPLRYTLKEDTWAASNVWGTKSFNSYGQNRPSGRDVLGLGKHKGEVFWYDLKKTLNADLKYFREW